MKGTPAKQINRYLRVSSYASGGTARSRRIRFSPSRSSTVAPAAAAANRVTEFPTLRAVLGPSFAPTAWLIDTVEPIARPTMTTVSMCITWLPTATAEMVPAPLYCPVMNMSARP